MTRQGAVHLGAEGTRFSVWAPNAREVVLALESSATVTARLDPAGDGYFSATIAGVGPGARYRYLLDGEGPFADPASRSQPEGVHGPSEVIRRLGGRRLESRSGGAGAWRGMPLASQVICELHVGTFSPAGTFAGAAEALPDLASSGYTAIELMPVGEFPGARNWGYDGVFVSAAQSSYGGPEGLASLCDTAHELGIAVILDVVYNHIGPEGSVHARYGPYFTDRYSTPWGGAINLDGPGSDGVRTHFVESACYYIGEIGVDGLRLDAVHAIVDQTASPFLGELAAAAHATARAAGRLATVVAENSSNDPRLFRSPEAGGLGLDGAWNDDFHHALRVALTGEHDRWFADFDGVGDLAEAMTEGYVLSGRRYSPVFGRHHGGTAAGGIEGDQLVVYAQNHDQIGNAGFGERLASRLPLAAQFPVAAAVLLAPFVPLRFMGEEYGETAPFHFFVSHTDPHLVEAVRRGRAEEVGAATGSTGPDPQAVETFEKSRPDRRLAGQGIHAELADWQRRLLELRALEPSLATLDARLCEAHAEAGAGVLIWLRRADRYLDADEIAVVCRLSAGDCADLAVDAGPLAGRCWEVLAGRNVAGVVGGDRIGGAAHAIGPEGPEVVVGLGAYAVLVLRGCR